MTKRCKCKPIQPDQGPRRERERIVLSFDVLNIPENLRKDILEALDSKKWDWYTECDGCTAVSEAYWPTKYFPPCLRHDFDYATGRGGIAASIRFYNLQRAYGMSRTRSGVRAAAVTVVWYGLYKWIRPEL